VLQIGDRTGHWSACWLYDVRTVAAEHPGSLAGAHPTAATPSSPRLQEEAP